MRKLRRKGNGKFPCVEATTTKQRRVLCCKFTKRSANYKQSSEGIHKWCLCRRSEFSSVRPWAFATSSMQLCKARPQTSDKEHPPLPSEEAMTISKRSARTSRQGTISKSLISHASTLKLDFRLVPPQDELEAFPQAICSTLARPVARLLHPSAPDSHQTEYGSERLAQSPQSLPKHAVAPKSLHTWCVFMCFQHYAFACFCLRRH